MRRVFLVPLLAVLSSGILLPASFTVATAQSRYVTSTSVRLRADSIETSRTIRTLRKATSLVPLGEHSDYTGFYRVASGPDTGWVAGWYLLEGEPELGPGLARARSGAHCSATVARGPVKLLKDQDAPNIHTTPKAATIAQLRALIRPAKRPDNARANEVEKTIYRVSGRVIRWGLEPDGDFHLVLASATSSSSTIVLEIPSNTCLAGGRADLKALVTKARTDTESALGTAPHSIKKLPTPRSVTVEGVGFFDFGHATGHPPNAFELHPVTKIGFH